MQTKFSPQQRANLRCCASCEWIYLGHRDCPKCGFASYGARYVYGKKAYRFLKTQQPWLNKKINHYKFNLLTEMRKTIEEEEKFNHLPKPCLSCVSLKDSPNDPESQCFHCGPPSWEAYFSIFTKENYA